MDLLALILLCLAFGFFIVEAIRSRGSLLALGLAAWVLAEIVVAWPK
jgi:hypothetical protein